MKLETAEVLAKAARDLQMDWVEVEEYAGRGMMGKKTWAIDLPNVMTLTKVACFAVIKMHATEANQFLSDLPTRWEGLGESVMIF